MVEDWVVFYQILVLFLDMVGVQGEVQLDGVVGEVEIGFGGGVVDEVVGKVVVYLVEILVFFWVYQYFYGMGYGYLFLVWLWCYYWFGVGQCVLQ